MKDDNLGKMGGRKSRKKVHKGMSEVQRLIELEKILSSPGGNQEQKEKYVQAIKDIELSAGIIAQYLDIMDTSNNEIRRKTRLITSCLFDQLAAQQEGPLDLYYNGRGKEFNGLIGRSFNGILIIENARAFTLHSSDTIVGINCGGIYTYESEFVIASESYIETTCNGTTIASKCRYVDTLISHHAQGEIILDRCQESRLGNDPHGYGYPSLPNIYCKGDLQTGHTNDNNEEIELEGHVTEMVITGKVGYHRLHNITDAQINELIEGSVSRSEEDFDKKYQERKLYLLDELASDCGPERKFDLVREIMETYK